MAVKCFQIIHQIPEGSLSSRSDFWECGSERGKISWSLDCSDPPQGCSYESEARMSSGEARIETHLDKTGECCILHYGWAYGAPTGSIKINWNPENSQYDIELSSW